ncbi:putative Pmp3 domain protein [Rhizoctonia solani 123E]|uniref:Putative Pmp3 domain protein n=1 Tax=Rhizoctonia solani 123E TaxID=1423351 RepID=A0A074SE06_9AGAM|nr:putative Pmp3 domain protein [Rhizoctonia solani 123E]
MAGAIDLMLYGIAIFISPVAVYFKKGVGAQFWVNCCLYCLMGVPGIIHAFYIIHTSKSEKDATPRSHPAHPHTTCQRSASLPSLPHSSRYRPQADFAPYEDHPPPIPPKAEDPSLPYDPALHPNAANTSIGRAKSVLHTYRIPQSTLHPPPLRRSRYSTPSPNLLDQEPKPEQEPKPDQEPEPQPQPVPETRASSSTLHPEAGGTSPYPAEYHPNSAGANIAKAKAVLHTYQIPETTLSPRTEEETPVVEDVPKPSKSVSIKGSMWPRRSKDKGLSPLDVNSPTAVPKPDADGHKSKWSTTGPSWLRRRRGRENIQTGAAGTDDEAPATMTMVWDDNFDSLRPRDRSPKQNKAHVRSGSEPVSLSFPAPPGAVRPVIDRTGTSNAPLLLQRRPHIRRDSALEAVAENTHIPEQTVSDSEEYAQKPSPTQDQWRADTDTELERSRSRIIARLGRRPRLDTVMDATTPTSFASAPVQAESPPAITFPRHIAPPAVLASSIDEPRASFFRHGRTRTSSDVAGANSNSTPRSSQSFRNDVDFAMGEYGLGRSGDAYSAATRALRSKERTISTSSSRALPSPMSGGKRLSVGTALSQVPTFASASTPAMRRDWTHGTFGTGATSESSDDDDIRSTSQRSKSEGALSQFREPEERSQDEEIEDWIKQEDERREASVRSEATSSSESEPSVHRVTPNPASIFSLESSGFAGLGVGTAHEKGRVGKIELWNQPNWNGSNPSTGQVATNSHSLSQQPEYLYAPSAETHENPANDPVPEYTYASSGKTFENPAKDIPEYTYASSGETHENSLKSPVLAPSTATHSSYATGQESFSPAPALISPPVSPNRPTHPTRPPPPVPGLETRPAPLRTGTFGTPGPKTQAGLLSPVENLAKPVVQVLPSTPPISPPRAAAPPRSSKPPPVPTRPGSTTRSQSPKLPPKPVALRSMSSEDDDMSEVYARALRN